MWPDYDENMALLTCDGCGQLAEQEHIARRLQRLENMTRYRPVHVHVLFLCAVAPSESREYLYSASDEFQGESAAILHALQIQQAGRSVDETLAVFQRAGYLLAYLLECPVVDAANRATALRRRLPSLLARIRRSYKPKRVVIVGQELSALVTQITAAEGGPEVILHRGQPFEWNELSPETLARGANAAT